MRIERLEPLFPALTAPRVRHFLLTPGPNIPNNPRLPVLYYPNVLPGERDGEQAFRTRLAAHGWSGVWIDGIYDYVHYHASAHEFLGVIRGRALLALGGPGGVEFEVQAGDALVLPAGTGHCNIDSSNDFLVIGAYPRGQQWDLCRVKQDQAPQASKIIAAVALPASDPLFGEDGPLLALWSVQQD
ncbi:MAG: cupin domain-containing protein [Bradymonadaceae bacterium]|nr:cupin domain-containing protein [Lujinxingiaceae bacterium]